MRFRTSARGPWRKAKVQGSSYVIPGNARVVQTKFRPGGKGRGIPLSEVERAKSKNPRRLGIKGLLRDFQKPPSKKSRARYETTREYLNRVLGNADGIWRLSVGVLPTALYWHNWVFFTDPSDLKRSWDRVRIWIAIESDGNSDGSTNPAGVKSYYVGNVTFEVPKKTRLSKATITAYYYKIKALFDSTEDGDAQNGIVTQHNDNPAFKRWAEEEILLGIEGVPRREVQRKTGPGRQAKGFRPGKQISRPRTARGVRHGDRKR